MAVREAELLASLGGVVQLVAGQVVAQHVAAVVGEPERLVERAPVEADGVAHAARHHLRLAAIGLHAQDLAVGRARHADVARRADADIQQPVRAEADELRAVVRLARQAIGDEHRQRRVLQPVVDRIEAHDLRDRRHVKLPAAIRHACRQRQARDQRVHATRFALIDLDRVDLALAHAADVDDALAVGIPAQRHRARVRHGIGQQFDPEAWRRAQALGRYGGVGERGAAEHDAESGQPAAGCDASR